VCVVAGVDGGGGAGDETWGVARLSYFVASIIII
jgi:hypothetical protein